MLAQKSLEVLKKFIEHFTGHCMQDIHTNAFSFKNTVPQQVPRKKCVCVVYVYEGISEAPVYLQRKCAQHMPIF